MGLDKLRATVKTVGVLAAMLAGSLAIVAGTNAAASADGDPLGAALTPVYASFRHLPTSAIGGVVPGSVHQAPVSPGGAQWAIASFKPAANAPADAASAFQDGASTGIFTQNPDGSWAMQQIAGEPLVCTQGVPGNLWQAWGIPTNGITCPIQQSVSNQMAKAPGIRLDTPAADTPGVQARTPKAAPEGQVPVVGGGKTAAPLVARSQPAGLAAQANAVGGAGAADAGGSVSDIAVEQIGVSDTPASTNWNLDCNPYTALDGFAQTTVGCGQDPISHVQDENELWCSDFAKWVWAQAGVPNTSTITPAAASFYTWGKNHGQALPTNPTNPLPGDAVVFYPAGSPPNGSYADHVGIVTAVNADGTIDMVNGDFMGATNIAVEYDANVNLGPWSAANWGNGEQWTFVQPTNVTTPPSTVGTTGWPISQADSPSGLANVVGTVQGRGLTDWSNVPGSFSWSSALVSPVQAWETYSLVRPSGEMDVVYDGPGNQIYWAYRMTPTSPWGGGPIGGAVGTNPVMVQRANGETDVVYVGAGNQLEYMWNPQRTANWPITPIGVVGTQPTVSLRPSGEVDVASVNSAGMIQFSYLLGSWGGGPLLSAIGNDPVMVQRPDGTTQIVYSQLNGQISYVTNPQWTGTWNSYTVSGAYGSNINVAVRPNGELDIAYVGAGGQNVWWAWQPAGQGSFVGGTPISGSAVTLAQRPSGESDIIDITSGTSQVGYAWNFNGSPSWGQVAVAGASPV